MASAMSWPLYPVPVRGNAGYRAAPARGMGRAAAARCGGGLPNVAGPRHLIKSDYPDGFGSRIKMSHEKSAGRLKN